MIIKSIHLKNFGVHKDTYAEFSTGINLVTGLNMSGKSTLMNTAISMLINTGLKTVSESNYFSVPKGSTAELVVLDTKADTEIKIRYAGSKCSVFIDGTEIMGEDRKTSIANIILNRIFIGDADSKKALDIKQIIKATNRISAYSINPLIKSTPVMRRTYLNNILPVLDTSELYSKVSELKKVSSEEELRLTWLEEQKSRIENDFISKKSECGKLLGTDLSEGITQEKIDTFCLLLLANENNLKEELRKNLEDSSKLSEFKGLLKTFTRNMLDDFESCGYDSQEVNRRYKVDENKKKVESMLSEIDHLELEKSTKLRNLYSKKNENEISNKEISTLNGLLESLQGIEDDLDISEVISQLETYEMSKKLTKEAQDKMAALLEIKKNLETTVNSLSPCTEEDIKTWRNSTAVIENEISQLKKMISSETGSVCKLCGQVISEEHKNSLRERLSELENGEILSLKEKIGNGLEYLDKNNSLQETVKVIESCEKTLNELKAVKEPSIKLSLPELKTEYSKMSLLNLCSVKSIKERKAFLEAAIKSNLQNIAELEELCDTVIPEKLNNLRKEVNHLLTLPDYSKLELLSKAYEQLNTVKPIGSLMNVASIDELLKNLEERREFTESKLKEKQELHKNITDAWASVMSLSNELSKVNNSIREIENSGKIIKKEYLDLLTEAFGTKGLSAFSLMRVSDVLKSILNDYLNVYLPEMEVDLNVEANKVEFTAKKADSSNEYDISEISGSEYRIISICIACMFKEFFENSGVLKLPNFICLDEIECGVSEERLVDFYSSVFNILSKNYKQLIFISPNRDLLNSTGRDVNVINLSADH